MSLGIIVSAILLIVPLMIKYGAVSVGIFWCRKQDFGSIGGFNEQMLMAEYADFTHRLSDGADKTVKPTERSRKPK